MGVANTCTIKGHNNCGNLSAVLSEKPCFYLSYLARIEGMVKADAMAMKSLRKNSANDLFGKGCCTFPNLSA